MRRWLIASAATVVLVVAVGGITRLTESGLSITEWRPVSGILPPLSSAEWNAAYQRYLQIPEALTVHHGITLGQFQTLFWWEWVHRLLARAAGLVLALPYFILLARRRIPAAYRARLFLLPVLAAAQGVLGWYMVKSGLAERTDVSAYRLTAHLALALVIYVVCVWTALDLGSPLSTPGRLPDRIRRASLAGVALTLITLLSGGFVAGLDGGKVYNTFPLMGGRIVPPGYQAYGSWWRNAFENPVAAQFNHRVLALGTAAALLLLAWAIRRPEAPAPLRHVAAFLALAVVGQVALGIATLLLAVPVALGVLHQLMGLAVMTAVLVAAHRARPLGAASSRPSLVP